MAKSDDSNFWTEFSQNGANLMLFIAMYFSIYLLGILAILAPAFW